MFVNILYSFLVCVPKLFELVLPSTTPAKLRWAEHVEPRNALAGDMGRNGCLATLKCSISKFLPLAHTSKARTQVQRAIATPLSICCVATAPGARPLSCACETRKSKVPSAPRHLPKLHGPQHAKAPLRPGPLS